MFYEKIIIFVKEEIGKEKVDDLLNNFVSEESKFRHSGSLKISFTTYEDRIHFYDIRIHYEKSIDLYDLEIRRINTVIEINKSLIIAKFNDQTNFIDVVQGTNYDEQYIVVMNLFELMCQSKNEQKRLENSLDRSQIVGNSLSFLSSDGEDLLSKALGKLGNVWGKVLKIFHNSRSSVIKERLIQNGFSKFYQSCQIQIIHNLMPQGLDRFFKLIETRLNIPENKRKIVSMILEESSYAETNIWGCFDIAFSIDKEGKTKFASIFSNRSENGKFTYVIIEIVSEFELAKDLLVIEEKLSIMGGLWSDSKIKIKSIPKSLTNDEIKTVFSFFQIVTYKRLAEQFGIKLDF
jgi:hypothetical protein